MIHNYNILDDRYCKKIEHISLIEKSMNLFEQYSEIFQEDDQFIIEYDDVHKLHILLHDSKIFGKVPLFYFNQDNFNQKKFHAFLFSVLDDVYAEYLI